MNLDEWLALEQSARTRICEGIASRVGAAFRGIASGAVPVAVFALRTREMLLVPGGTVALGWDGSELALDEPARARWADEAASTHASFEEHVRPMLGERRVVTLSSFLIERAPCRVEDVFDPYDVDDPEAALRALVEAEGFRLPTGDEWEHAMRAGTDTFFPWGDAWPEGIPVEGETSFGGHAARSRLGLEVLSDPYQVEIVADRDHVRAGDGGTSICGDQPWPEPWLSFALAFRWPRSHWADVVTELFETAHFRRALGPLPLE